MDAEILERALHRSISGFAGYIGLGFTMHDVVTLLPRTACVWKGFS